jgi:hypothetical protein
LNSELLESELNRLQEIAASTPVIKRLWLFGSRYRMDHSPDSDLDIAVEVEWIAGQGLGACEDHFSLWCATEEKFRDAMTSGCPWVIDIQCYAGEEGTPNIHRYLQSGSKLIYEKT